MSHPSRTTRRRFLTGAAATGGAVVLAPQTFALGLASARKAPVFRGGRFADGVICGDPTPTGCTLWSRVTGVEGAGRVELEVATDRAFRRVVQRRQIATSGAANHAVKARLTGLKPYEQYYYRFSTRTGESRVGRLRTALPAGSQQPVRFAFFSCQDYTHGWYNAHEVMAKEDLDFVVCLGDYIYSETYHSVKGTKTAVRDDRIGRSGPNRDIVREALTLSDYRAKYSLYRSDPALQAVHARFPMVMLWDDHEVQDNYAGAEKDGGLPAAKRYGAARKAAARKAFFESMPAFPGSSGQRIYRSLRFGDVVDLVVMDQRSYRQDQPCGDAVVAPCAELEQPRALLGRTQLDAVKQRLGSSTAAWKVLANEVTMMPTRVLGGANYSYDTWSGYPGEREELLGFLRDRAIKDTVFITGDIHTFIAGDVRTAAGETVATEFVGGSITSQSLGETKLDVGGGVVLPGNDANPQTDPGLIDTLRGFNPWVDQADFDHHGYGKVVATPSAFDCQMVRMETIKRRTTKTLPSTGWRYRVARGQQSIKGVNGPPATA
ncbi:alkaline phosphatase D family protein [Paraconexibacter algicola]|uniref:Alkaline phosphatase n=1 Tax=Paraconexibacter algicola TaxID=2133960 RepID=A0A2T4UKT5_9ACTN|nr:alkaline phosphatase D family protein [Paraconexibacter algicola]PTL59831.1 alkaline phosphatase [Paraconexibacter algicola]